MLIFIAGVHGVGKGYLCSFAKDDFGVTHVSASELIKNNSNIKFDNSKLTATPDKNQSILLTALNALKSKVSNILLDGHFTLINKNGDDYKYVPYLKCGKYYETTSLVDYIKKNEPIVTSDDGLYQYNNKLIFRGEDPYNYVKIDEGLYRIIEIEDDRIRLLSVDKYKNRINWDDRYNINEGKYVGINEFGKSRLKDSLEYAYNSDFFSDIERSFMVSYDLCIGKRELDDESIDGVVECSNKYPDMKIGMLYASEYMRGSIDPNCTSTSDLSCTNYNYFDSISSDFNTITAVADNTYQFYVVSGGVLNVKKASSNFTIYPVIYIDKNALYADGDGSYDTPYEIR